MNTRRNNRHLIYVLASLLLISILLTHTSYSLAVTYYPRAIVDVHEDSYLKVRRGPSSDYPTTYVNLASRAVISILEVQDGWALVQFPKLIGVREPIGWVCMDYLEYDERDLKWMN